MAPNWLAVAAAGGLSIVVALYVHRRLTRGSALDGSPLKRAGKKQMLVNRAIKGMKSKRRSIDERGSYFAFVSHMKAEAAMEARFLQIELEQLQEDELVFLDSDDLRDLTKLVAHVKKSRCLILVQTRKVLTRPYCILEVLTAIESRIPIVCVTVGGKPADQSYNFEEMAQLMTWMDSELEEWNPGAADVLRDYGYEDLTDVAYRLSTTVPKTISVSLNTGASRNMLRATIEDLVSSVEEARELLNGDQQGRDVQDKEAWLAARAKTSRPAPRAPKTTAPVSAVHAHGSPPAAPVASLAGRGLVTAAATTPGLLPLAFAVQSLVHGAKMATVEPDECARVAAAAEPLERVLLATAARASPAALQQVNVATEALAALQARCSAKGGGGMAELGASAFEAAKASLVTSIGELCMACDSAEGRAAASDVARALQGLPIAPAVAAAPTKPAVDAAMADALQASQEQAEAARVQRELLEMQNKVLMEQVQQMQAMMAQQQMSIQSFMTKFPQPADEAERRLVLLKKNLMSAPISEFTKIDELLQNMVMSNAFGPECRVAFFNVIGENEQRGLSMCLKLDNGGMLTTADMPQMMIDERVNRKATMCQYVVASGEYTCARKNSSASQCFMMDFMRKGINLMEEDPAMHEVMEGIKATDADFAESVDKMRMLQPVMATAAEIDQLPTMKRLSTKIQRAMIKGAVGVAAKTTKSGQFVEWMTATMGAADMTYIGAPVYCEGRAMGSLCGMFAGGAAEGPGEEVKAKLERGAARLGAVLDALSPTL